MAGVGCLHCSSYPSLSSVWFSLRTPSTSLSTTTTTLTNVSHARMPEASHHLPHTCTPPFPSHLYRFSQLHFDTVLHSLFLFNTCTFLNTPRPFSVHLHIFCSLDVPAQHLQPLEENIHSEGTAVWVMPSLHDIHHLTRSKPLPS